jgi:hypothetical protein
MQDYSEKAFTDLVDLEEEFLGNQGRAMSRRIFGNPALGNALSFSLSK